MPTGYTHEVATGKISDFPTFALTCARAFGALIVMRDEPMSADIPKSFQPSDYHQLEGEIAKAELSRLERLSTEEASVERDVCEAKRIAERTARLDRQMEQKDRYEAMLSNAKTWVPPTAEHEELKQFMISQLVEGIEFDCRPSSYDSEPIPDAKQWLSDAIAEAKRKVQYHAEEYKKEVERTDDRNAWVSQLRYSLKSADPTP